MERLDNGIRSVPKKSTRCECTLAPHTLTGGGVVPSYRDGKPDPLSGKGRCSRRATASSCGLFVCAQHARYLNTPMAR